MPDMLINEDTLKSLSRLLNFSCFTFLCIKPAQHLLSSLVEIWRQCVWGWSQSPITAEELLGMRQSGFFNGMATGMSPALS